MFHVDLLNLQMWEDVWHAIGARMLLQLLQTHEPNAKRVLIGDIYSSWYAPTPPQVMRVLATGNPDMESTTVVLVVDNLHRILETQGDYIMYQVLTLLKGFARRGFFLVCGTSAVDGPVDEVSPWIVHLPCDSYKVD